MKNNNKRKSNNADANETESIGVSEVSWKVQGQERQQHLCLRLYPNMRAPPLESCACPAEPKIQRMVGNEGPVFPRSSAVLLWFMLSVFTAWCVFEVFFVFDVVYFVSATFLLDTLFGSCFI